MPIDSANPFSAPTANLENPTAAPVAGDVLAAPTTRLAAVLLDGALFLPAVVIMAVGGVFGKGAGGSVNLPAMLVAGLYGLALAAYQIYLLSTKGQTMGKRWMKIRIVRMDGSAPGFVHAFLLRSIVSGLPRLIPLAGNAFSLVDALFIFRQDRRCIHDSIAGTRVVPAA